jgi:hypothetical protein
MHKIPQRRPVRNGKLTKKGAKYHQFFAVRKAAAKAVPTSPVDPLTRIFMRISPESSAISFRQSAAALRQAASQETARMASD